MKKLILLFGLFMIGFTSCQKEEIEPVIITEIVTQTVTDTVYVDCEDEVGQILNYHILVQGLGPTSGSIWVNGANNNQFSFERFVQSGDLVQVYSSFGVSLTEVRIYVNNDLVHSQDVWQPMLVWEQVMP